MFAPVGWILFGKNIFPLNQTMIMIATHDLSTLKIIDISRCVVLSLLENKIDKITTS